MRRKLSKKSTGECYPRGTVGSGETGCRVERCDPGWPLPGALGRRGVPPPWGNWPSLPSSWRCRGSSIVGRQAVRWTTPARTPRRFATYWARGSCRFWMDTALAERSREALTTGWILDCDATVKLLYGHQDCAEVGYNPTSRGGNPDDGTKRLISLISSIVATCLSAGVSSMSISAKNGSNPS